MGDNRGQRRSLDAHIETEHQNGIQNDIGSGADDHGEHTHGGISLGVDKVVQTQGDLHEDSTQ